MDEGTLHFMKTGCGVRPYFKTQARFVRSGRFVQYDLSAGSKAAAAGGRGCASQGKELWPVVCLEGVGDKVHLLKRQAPLHVVHYRVLSSRAALHALLLQLTAMLTCTQDVAHARRCSVEMVAAQLSDSLLSRGLRLVHEVLHALKEALKRGVPQGHVMAVLDWSLLRPVLPGLQTLTQQMCSTKGTVSEPHLEQLGQVYDALCALEEGLNIPCRTEGRGAEWETCREALQLPVTEHMIVGSQILSMVLSRSDCCDEYQGSGDYASSCHEEVAFPGADYLLVELDEAQCELDARAELMALDDERQVIAKFTGPPACWPRGQLLVPGPRCSLEPKGLRPSHHGKFVARVTGYQVFSEDLERKAMRPVGRMTSMGYALNDVRLKLYSRPTREDTEDHGEREGDEEATMTPDFSCIALLQLEEAVKTFLYIILEAVLEALCQIEGGFAGLWALSVIKSRVCRH
ncbi:hypothetical protein CYMTET_14973 [Cymbomonas tetramitiformis]|uniref:Uncharacterized protein n=1 Tax=Cymbomonas tetramitiformis TaxID=36881 RepID=A0AAE0GGH1_9CHLO|nr:hypothetical protein CYMTET_14973 [Cymbomonas tetramitiformis]